MATPSLIVEIPLMAASEKVKILLADEDALRRDGLAAVLQANADFEVVAQCADGEAALRGIREIRPDVAVVDLNLPAVHGIELIRRVRGEVLGTKIVVLAGTTDDDIIREVVRAGGDAYLLKNGPARHLLDAISYVRDGGQYFSPQLRRDGVNRHLLEEPPRIQPGIPAVTAPQTQQMERDLERVQPDAGRPRESRSSRYSRTSGRGGPRFRERIRENSEAGEFEEKDYEILDMMAEGIRPILDRLDEIENRVGEMETGASAVPGNVRGWLSSQIADTFRDAPGASRELVSARNVSEIEARLPKLIEDAVTARFQNMAGKLQQEIEETHLRTLETFVKNIQVKLVQRVSALETDMGKQAEAMRQLREYSQRTEDNLSRLISGVDKLAQELPRRLPPAPEAPTVEDVLAPTPKPVREERMKSRRRFTNNHKVLLFWAALAVFVAGIVTVVNVMSRPLPDQLRTATGSSPKTDSSAPQKSVARPSANADTKTKMQAAEEATDRKEYSLAEDIYRQVLQAEPNNGDAMKGLASVLYREDKIEESAAVLEKLPKTN